MVLRAYRLQRHGTAREREILTRVCEELYYQGRYVWLCDVREVQFIGATLSGPNRIRYRLMDTKELKCVALPRKRVPITASRVVAALPVVKGRRRTMFLFVPHSFMDAHRWDCAPSNVLMPEELAYLHGKPQPPDLETVVRQICRFRHLIDWFGALTREGKRILAGHRRDSEE